MEEFFPLLQTVELFSGISAAELSPLLSCLRVVVRRYARGQTVFASGESIRHFGVLLSGQVQVVQDDYYGNRSILGQFGPGDLVGESFACAESPSLPVDVIATTDSEAMLIDCRRLASPCEKACGFHNRLVQNMMRVLSRKNIALTRKMQITSRRTTREKLLSYLAAEAVKNRSNQFDIPFNRQELADYLNVERSAMSAELSRLRNDGLLNFSRNRFELKRAVE
jgi:CRP-like cAMP-binding protein